MKLLAISILKFGKNIDFFAEKNVSSFCIEKQEAHGPRLAHLSNIATADMQMLCNIFPNPIIATNAKIIIWAVLSFEEEYYLCLTVNDHLNKLSITFQQ